MTPELQKLKLVASRLSQQSPDPHKKVACLALDEFGNLLGHGINHPGHYAKMTSKWWLDRENRRPFVVHAEIDMLAKVRNLPIKSILITLLPCVPCMNTLAAFGIKTVYYMDWYTKDMQAFEVAKHHGIECKRI